MIAARVSLWIMMVAVPGLLHAEEGTSDPSRGFRPASDDSSTVSVDSLESSTTEGDDEWTEEIWNEIDYMVQMEAFKLQKTVVTSGVRGDESEEDRLEYLQFINAAPRPSKKNISDAISALKGSLERDEALLEQGSADGTTATKLDGTAKKRLFIARAHEQIGQIDSSRTYYMSLLAEQYADIGHAAEARSHLAELKEDAEEPADSSSSDGD